MSEARENIFEIREDFYLNGEKFKIISGEIPIGEKLASVRELAQEAGVNPNTMQRKVNGKNAVIGLNA